MGSRRALSATRPRAVRRALRSVATPALAGLLLAAPAAAAAPAHAGWYVGAGAGVNWAFDMDQEGWNRDPVCYPTDACFEAVAAPAIPGYRWRYGVDQDLGTAFELSLGRRFARTRLALSLARHRNDSHQGFRGITYLDGTPREPRDGPVVSEGGAGIGHLRAHTVSLNAYYDFPVAYHRITPYLGGGLGAAFVKVTRLTFDSTYRDTSAAPRAYDPPLAFYAGSQDVSVSRHRVRVGAARRRRRSAERPHTGGGEADLCRAGYGRGQLRLRAAFGAPVGSGIYQPDSL